MPDFVLVDVQKYDPATATFSVEERALVDLNTIVTATQGTAGVSFSINRHTFPEHAVNDQGQSTRLWTRLTNTRGFIKVGSNRLLNRDAVVSAHRTPDSRGIMINVDFSHGTKSYLESKDINTLWDDLTSGVLLV